MLLGGVALGMSSSPRQYYKTLKKINRDWKNANEGNLRRCAVSLSKEKLVEEKILPDGSYKLVLTAKGRKHAKLLNLMGGSIDFKRPQKWDWKWRIVMFDIPEKDRSFRDVLRNHLKELNFLKLQQSVFISPYPFEKMISELVALYSAQKYVRIITAEKLDNEKQITKQFFKDNKKTNLLICSRP